MLGCACAERQMRESHKWRSAQEGSGDNWESTRFFSPAVLHTGVGWELGLEDINHGISAFGLCYELEYQIRSLHYTGYNEIFMKVDITDGF